MTWDITRWLIIQGVQFKTESANLLIQDSLQRHCAPGSGRHRCHIIRQFHREPYPALSRGTTRYDSTGTIFVTLYISGRWRSSEELVGPPGCCHVVALRFHYYSILHCQPRGFPHSVTSRHACWIPGRPRQAVQDTVRPTQQFSINDLLPTDVWHRG